MLIKLSVVHGVGIQESVLFVRHVICAMAVGFGIVGALIYQAVMDNLFHDPDAVPIYL